jgi:membrane associated rhomboid family serine protease
MASILRRPLRYRYYNATIVLVAINLLVYLASLAPGAKSLILDYLGMTPIDVLSAGAWWQVITYMFVQVEWWHMFFNMLMLFMFGLYLERRMGSTEFLVFYLFCGVAVGAASLLLYYALGALGVTLIGASGAVFGVLLGFGTLFPDETVYIFGILPARGPVIALAVLGISLVFQFIGLAPRVANFAHFTGLIFAFLYLVIRTGINPISVFFRRR